MDSSGFAAWRRIAAEREKLQRAIDWMFMLTVEWFGLPDTEKRHTEQLDYGFKGRSNDALRQAWMGKVVPFCEEVGLGVPAHFDADVSRPTCWRSRSRSRFDAPAKRWAYEDGQIGWDEVLERWKARGPMNQEYVASLQRGWATRHDRVRSSRDSGWRCARSRTLRFRSRWSTWG